MEPKPWIVPLIMKALINKILEFSNVDGPGNRLAIFFQSCPFSCLYCHNPETLARCNNCGDCVEVCPGGALRVVNGEVLYQENLCRFCDSCVKKCLNYADPRVKEYEVTEVLTIIKANLAYIRGITVSGGEPMVYPDYLLSLFKEVKKLGLSCLVDTNGHYDFSLYPELLENCDGVMLDVKAIDEEFHHYLTGQSNKNVLNNLDYLLTKEKLIEVRTVLLPGYKLFNEETLTYVIKKLKGRCDYKLIRYRPYGVRPAGRAILGESELSETEYQSYVNYARKQGGEHLVLL